MAEVGSRRCSRFQEYRHLTSLLWVIKSFKDEDFVTLDYIQSCDFEASNKCKFNLQLRFPQERKLSDNFSMKIVLKLQENACNKPLSCYVKLSILDNEFCERNTMVKHFVFSYVPGHCYFDSFTKLGTLLNKEDELLFCGDLMLFCRITICDKLIVQENKNAPLIPILRERQCYLLETGLFSDFVVCVKGTRFPCHKFILDHRCEYFSALLRHDMRENQENKLTLRDIEPDTFGKVLRYIYTGETNVSENDMLSLLAAADRFGLDELVAPCEDQLYSCLNFENVEQTFHIASTYNLQRLKMESYRIKQCFGEKAAISDSLCSLTSKVDDKSCAITKAAQDVNGPFAVEEASVHEKKAVSYIGGRFSKRLKLRKTSCEKDLSAPLAELPCRVEQGVNEKSAVSDSLQDQPSSAEVYANSETKVPKCVNDQTAGLITSNAPKKVVEVPGNNVDSFIGSMPLRNRNLQPPFAEFWCRTEKVTLAKSMWRIENFTLDYFYKSNSEKSHTITSNDGAWQVEISGFQGKAWGFDFLLDSRILWSKNQVVSFIMTYSVSILNEKQEINVFCRNSVHFNSKSNIPSQVVLLNDNRLSKKVMTSGWVFQMLITFMDINSVLYESPRREVSRCKSADFLSGDKFSDMVIKVRGEEFLSHKAILAYHSSFISVKLKANSSSQALIEIDEIEPDIFKKLYTFMYTGRGKLTQAEVKKLIPFTNKYGFADVLRSFKTISCIYDIAAR